MGGKTKPIVAAVISVCVVVAVVVPCVVLLPKGEVLYFNKKKNRICFKKVLIN